MTVRCDQLRVEQVVTNLISNAIKYSPAGGTVEVALESHDEEVEISVTDQGVGISEEDREECSTRSVESGSRRTTCPAWGSASSSCESSSSLMAGASTSRAGAAMGSTFRVRLPLRAEREAATGTEALLSALH